MPIKTHKTMELTLTLAPNFFLFGFDYYEREEMFDFNELNIYIICLEIKITW